MAGNQTDARRRADNALADAKRAGLKPGDKAYDTLQSERDAARATELRATGQNEQAKSWF